MPTEKIRRRADAKPKKPNRHPKAQLKLLLLRSLDGPATGRDRRRLTLVELRVLLALFAHSDDDGIAFPSIKTLAEFAGCAKRPQKARDALRLLSRLGYHVRRHQGGGFKNPSVRRLMIGTATGDAASPVARVPKQVTARCETGDGTSPELQVTARCKQVTRRHPEVAIGRIQEKQPRKHPRVDNARSRVGCSLRDSGRKQVEEIPDPQSSDGEDFRPYR
jgi:hypothetical protein